MAPKIYLQNVSNIQNIPHLNQFKQWAKLTLQDRKKVVLSIRIVDEQESTKLNRTYRHKQGPTNILSFPNSPMLDNYLGDLVICAPVVNQEAIQQQKSHIAHWAHITIHGILHLLGYDHIEESDAEIMENLEIKLLHQLGFPNPYESY